MEQAMEQLSCLAPNPFCIPLSAFTGVVGSKASGVPYEQNSRVGAGAPSVHLKAELPSRSSATLLRETGGEGRCLAEKWIAVR